MRKEKRHSHACAKREMIQRLEKIPTKKGQGKSRGEGYEKYPGPGTRGDRTPYAGLAMGLP